MFPYGVSTKSVRWVDSLTIISGSTYTTLHNALSGRTLTFCVYPVKIDTIACYSAKVEQVIFK